MKVLMSVAATEDHAIGSPRGMLWRGLKHDIDAYYDLVDRHPVIVGSTTWGLLPEATKPRYNQVVMTSKYSSWRCASSVEEALGKCKDLSGYAPLVIGGAAVYKAFWPVVTDLHFTTVHMCTEVPDAIKLDLLGDVMHYFYVHDEKEMNSHGIRYTMRKLRRKREHGQV